MNKGSDAAAREFALLSKAYHVLSDPQERAYYDQQLLAQSNANYSILHSDNPHARRARNVAVQARWDRVVDEVLERDRKENRERQRASLYYCFAVSVDVFCRDDATESMADIRLRRTSGRADALCDQRMASCDQVEGVFRSLHLHP